MGLNGLCGRSGRFDLSIQSMKSTMSMLRKYRMLNDPAPKSHDYVRR